MSSINSYASVCLTILATRVTIHNLKGTIHFSTNALVRNMINVALKEHCMSAHHNESVRFFYEVWHNVEEEYNVPQKNMNERKNWLAIR